jgi:phosphoribosyl 1,2-cyclic phosphodiesterase
VSVQFTILGSGSSGNCAYLETAETRILIDAGLSGRQIRQRLASIGRTPENLAGILLTHEHTDHTQGLAVIAAKLRIPLFCNRATQEALATNHAAPLDCRLFQTGAKFEVGDIVVESFTVPHDAQDPVGYLVRTPHGNLGFITDLGHITKLVIDRMRHAHALVLETNHDVKMLQDDARRPWSLKQRILSRHGHLSNEAAADAIEQIVSADLRHLYLGHLSRDCNRPEIAHRVLGERLHNIGATHVQVQIASPDLPSPTLILGPRPDNGSR